MATRTHTIDGVAFELEGDFDFSFLSGYGRVFAVFDQQDSGSISFGVQKRSRKCFIKVAGAPFVTSPKSSGRMKKKESGMKK